MSSTGLIVCMTSPVSSTRAVAARWKIIRVRTLQTHHSVSNRRNPCWKCRRWLCRRSGGNIGKPELLWNYLMQEFVVLVSKSRSATLISQGTFSSEQISIIQICQTNNEQKFVTNCYLNSCTSVNTPLRLHMHQSKYRFEMQSRIQWNSEHTDHDLIPSSGKLVILSFQAVALSKSRCRDQETRASRLLFDSYSYATELVLTDSLRTDMACECMRELVFSSFA